MNNSMNNSMSKSMNNSMNNKETPNPGNIHKINVDKVQKEVEEMLVTLKELQERGEQIGDWEDSLKNKYKYLHKKSTGLFNFIIKNYGTEKFTQTFDHTLDMMLKNIQKIQRSEISQYDASATVGTVLAKRYIPQLRD